MKIKLPLLISVIAATLLITGCETSGVSGRIAEKSATFNALTPQQKQNIQEGVIGPGYTKDMTYIALGKPSKVESKDNSDGKVEIWTYKNYYPSGRLEAYLTEYSRARNPNLERSLNLEVGKATVNPNAPGNKVGLGSTANSNDPGLSLPDVPVYNLFLIFSEGKIVDIQLESLDGTVF